MFLMHLQEVLPPNAACSAPPDSSLDFHSSLAAAEAAFERLFPDEAAAQGHQLFAGAASSAGGDGSGEHGGGVDGSSGGGGERGAHGAQNGVAGGPDAEDSDDETLAALETAMAGVGSYRSD